MNSQLFSKFWDFPFTNDTTPVQNLFTGINFVFTGRLAQWTRAEASLCVRAAGGSIQNQVSKKTHYVVVGEAPSDSKINKAKTLSCTLLYEDQFRVLMGLE